MGFPEDSYAAKNACGRQTTRWCVWGSAGKGSRTLFPLLVLPDTASPPFASPLRPDFSYHKLTAACFLSASLEVHLLTYTLEVPFQRKL